jgi:hypothetical protein
MRHYTKYYVSDLIAKQIVLNNELLLSQVISQEAIIRLLAEKGIFSKEEFLKMGEVVDQDMKRKRKRPNRKEVCDYEVYINRCFNRCSRFVRDFCMCHSTNRTDR